MLRIVLVIAVLLCVLAGSAAAHIPPPLWMTVKVGDEEVNWTLHMQAEIFEYWFKLKAKPLADASEEEAAALREAVNRILDKFTAVEIDRVPVKGRLANIEINKIQDHGGEWPYAVVTMAFATKGKPKQVSLTWNWEAFEAIGGDWMMSIDAEIEAGEDLDYFLFSKSEPQYVWHAPRKPTIANPFEPPKPVAAPTQTIPLISLGLIGLALLAFPVLRVYRVKPGIRAATIGMAIALAVVFSGTAKATISLPWGPRFERPTEEQAKEIFSALHKNIYRAFDYEREEDVYDTLRLSVTGDLLDKVYAEVYGSLIMRDQGGAVLKVLSTKILALDIGFPEKAEEPWFTAACRWQVHGRIGHWGHTHVRVNEYQADYTVVLTDAGWRIAAVTVTAQKRLDSQRFGRGPGGENDKNDKKEEPK
jgi:hypothetical protein